MKTKPIIYLLIFFLSSCSSIKSSDQTPAITPAASNSSRIIPLTKTALPTNTEIDTITPLPARSPTPPNTPTPTQPSSYLTKRCVNEISSEQENILSSGSILYFWPKADAIMSFQSDASSPVKVLPGWSYFSVSPYTGTYLWVTTPEVYEVKTSEGNLYKTDFTEDWGSDRQWLLNDRILIGHYPAEFYPDLKAKDDIYVLTLSTGDYQHYHFDLPEYYAYNGGDGMIAKPVYDPTGNFVAYGWDNPDTLESGMLVWDIQNKKEIWKRSGWGWFSWTDGISWQYDGSHVFIVAPPIGKERPAEIFSIDREGNETQLSNLGEIITTTYDIHDLFISPDGNKVAFSVDADIPSPNNLRSLYVLNIPTGEVIDYCITVYQTMVWSPESDQLAFSSEPVDGQPKLIVLDINSGRKMAIDDQTRGLYGWVNWSPP